VPFKTVDLSPYLDNTDSQEVATAGSNDVNLHITGAAGAGVINTITNVLVPSNGTDGQVLTKGTGTNYGWQTATDDQTLSIDSVAVTGGRRFTLTIENGNSISFIDSIADGGSVNTDSTTVLFQDSILIYYTLNGAEYGRDTIRIAGGGGGGISGSGTTNYVSKWTGTTSQGNSQIYDDGSDIGIRTTSPVSGLHLSKTLAVNTGEFMTVSEVTSGNSVKIGLYYLSGFNRYPGIWLNQATPNTTNYAFLRDPDNNRTIFNSPADGFINFRVNNVTQALFDPQGRLSIYTGNEVSPFATLDVVSKGSTTSTGALYIRNSSLSNLIYMSDAGDFTVYNEVRLGAPTGPLIKSGSGTPEGVVTAPIGSMFLRTNGGAGTTLYIKESGTGNTGWIGK
jgi:hypothetical protein